MRIRLTNNDGESAEFATTTERMQNVHSVVFNGKHYAYSSLEGYGVARFHQVTAPVHLTDVIGDVAGIRPGRDRRVQPLSRKHSAILVAALVQLDHMWKKGISNSGMCDEAEEYLRGIRSPIPHESEVAGVLALAKENRFQVEL